MSDQLFLLVVNCFIQVASSCDGIHARSVLYAILSKSLVFQSHLFFLSDLVLWPALAMFSFYKGYYAIC